MPFVSEIIVTWRSGSRLAVVVIELLMEPFWAVATSTGNFRSSAGFGRLGLFDVVVACVGRRTKNKPATTSNRTRPVSAG